MCPHLEISAWRDHKPDLLGTCPLGKSTRTNEAWRPRVTEEISCSGQRNIGKREREVGYNKNKNIEKKCKLQQKQQQQ